MPVRQSCWSSCDISAAGAELFHSISDVLSRILRVCSLGRSAVHNTGVSMGEKGVQDVSDDCIYGGIYNTSILYSSSKVPPDHSSPEAGILYFYTTKNLNTTHQKNVLDNCKKPILEPPYIESHHRICTYNETKMVTVKLPKCAPDVDPFYTYPVAIRCDCDICSTATTECETY
ncbi:hypothetical protein BTVI_24688 [Pitangus sulphuratus]|nr:hypothetical protein BTVI_24688 [Pitangus sulphuratus]